METMQQRIDALIRMRREKPEYKHEWETLKGHLIRLLPAENVSDLTLAFQEIEREEATRKYDNLFHEVLITGKMTDGYSIALDNSAYASATARQLTSALLAIGKETLSERDIKEMKAEMAKYNAGQARK